MIELQTFSRLVARNELIRLQLEKSLQIIVPGCVGRAVPLIERAFELEAFSRLIFYARRGDGLAFAALRIEYDRDIHEEQLLLCPEVGLDSSWVDDLAPDLKATADFFRRFSKRYGKSVSARMVIHREAWPDAPASAPPIRWVPSPTMEKPENVLELPELTCAVRLIDSAPV